MFFNKIAVLMLAACAASVCAKGTSDSQINEVKERIGPPCMIKITETNWANANALETVWYRDNNACLSRTCKPTSEVVWNFGRNYVYVKTDDPIGEINRYIKKVEEQCK